MCRRPIRWFVLLSATWVCNASVGQEVKSGNFQAEDLLTFIEGFRRAGCDLNSDGDTGLADLLLLGEEGFDRCFFNEFLQVNEDPSNPLALIFGRSPQAIAVYGDKDSQGNLIRSASLTIGDASGSLLEAAFDAEERPISLSRGDIHLTAEYSGATGFTFAGTAGGFVISGSADFSTIPVGFPGGVDSGGGKRDYDDATDFCRQEQEDLMADVFGLDLVFPSAAVAQAAHMTLSFFLTDEAQFPADNEGTCECLLRAFKDDQGDLRDDDRVQRIIALNLATTPLMAVYLAMRYREDDCTEKPQVYHCRDVDLIALRKSIENTSRLLSFLALMSNSVFLELAGDTVACGAATPTPTLSATATPTPPGSSVIIPDPNLEAAVRDAISKPEGEILPEDLETLTSLQARFRNIQDIEGLQYATNLDSLDLERNQVQDLSPLAELTGLYSLNMNHNQVSDLTPLQDLTNLDLLALRQNPLANLAALADMTALTSLDVGNCGLTALSGLENLISLRELDIRENNIGSMTALTNLVEMRKLDVRRTEISDLSPVAGMVYLQTLYAHGDKVLSVTYQNHITSVAPLQSLKFLNYVGLPGNLIEELDGLVANLEFAANDSLSIYSNPLSENARNVQIPALRARGVTVDY